jgi:hypothetical protein
LKDLGELANDAGRDFGRRAARMLLHQKIVAQNWRVSQRLNYNIHKAGIALIDETAKAKRCSPIYSQPK